MLIPKLRLLVERVQNRKECPLYIKPYLFQIWQDIKDNCDAINKLRPCETQISIFFKSTFKRLFGKRRTSSAPYT